MHVSISSGVKLLILILVVVELVLVDPRYITAYININTGIVLLYIVSALTLLYCIASVVLYVVTHRRDGLLRKDDTEVPTSPDTNHSIAELILAASGIIAWLVITGLSGSISQSTSSDSGDVFGWIGALAGVIVFLFIVIAAVFGYHIYKDKFSGDRRRLPTEPVSA